MVGVFSTFATSRTLGLQPFGVGLGVAVLIDATLIRVVLRLLLCGPGHK